MPLIDNIDWDSVPEVQASAHKGFMGDKVIMKKLEEWDPNYVYAMCPRGPANEPTRYVPDMQEVGWQFLKVEHFGEKNFKSFNENTGLRYNLTSDDGRVRYRNAWIMYMPKNRRQRYEALRDEAAERNLREMQAKLQVPGSPAEGVGSFGDGLSEIKQTPADVSAHGWKD